MARLTWREGKLTFTGDMDAAAQIMFEKVVAMANANDLGRLRHDLYRLATAVNALYKVKESSPEALAVYRPIKTLVDTYAPPPG